MTERAEGFYWIKPASEWIVAHYGSHPGRSAWVDTDERDYVDADLCEIDERRIERRPPGA